MTFLHKSSLLFSLMMFSVITSFAQFKNINKLTATFQIKNAGITVDGKFTKVSAVVNVDEKNIPASSFTGTIQANSVSTGNNLRDNHLKNKSEFFDVEKFPTIEMKATKIYPSPYKGSYKVDWLLTMKGISKKVTTDVLIAPQGESILLLTVFKLNRLDWTVGDKGILMSNEVLVNINCVATK